MRLLQELKAGHAAELLTEKIQTTVTVRREGQIMEVPSEELVVGDIVQLSAGDRVPADIRLSRTNDLFVSQSLLTGESTILEKNAERLNPVSYTHLDVYKRQILYRM